MRIRTLAAAALALGVALAAAAPASAHMHFGGHHFGGHHFGGGHFGPWRHGGWGVVEVEGDGCIRWRPSYDDDGEYLGRRPVNICE